LHYLFQFFQCWNDLITMVDAQMCYGVVHQVLADETIAVVIYNGWNGRIIVSSVPFLPSAQKEEAQPPGVRRM
jgi:hypothetical protein